MGSPTPTSKDAAGSARSPLSGKQLLLAPQTHSGTWPRPFWQVETFSDSDLLHQNEIFSW